MAVCVHHALRLSVALLLAIAIAAVISHSVFLKKQAAKPTNNPSMRVRHMHRHHA